MFSFYVKRPRLAPSICRHLCFEQMESRIPLDADFDAQIRLETTTLAGEPTDSFAVGEEFLLRVFVQDTRQPDEVVDGVAGVMAAFINVSFSDNLLPSGRGTLSEAFMPLPFTERLLENKIDGIFGLRADLAGSDQSEELFYEIPFMAVAAEEPAELAVSPGPSKAGFRFHGQRDSVQGDEVQTDSVTLSIRPDFAQTPITPDEASSLYEPVRLNRERLDEFLAQLAAIAGGAEDPVPIGSTPTVIDFGSQLIVQIRIELTDKEGQPAAEFELGKDYVMRVFVKDLRDPDSLSSSAGGIFSANVDLEFSENIELTGDVAFSAEFGNLRSPGKPVGSKIENVGAALKELAAPGQQEQFLFEAPFVIASVATPAAIVATPSAATNEPLNVFGFNESVPHQNVASASVTLPILEPPPASVPPSVDPPPPSASPPEPPPQQTLQDPVGPPAPESTPPETQEEGPSETVLVSLVPPAPVDVPVEPSFERQLELPATPPLELSEDVRGLLLPWFVPGQRETRSDPRDSFEFRPAIEEDEDDANPLELAVPIPLEEGDQTKSLKSKSILNQTDDDEAEEESDQETADRRLAPRLSWDDRALLEGRHLEPPISTLRMQFRLYTPADKVADADGRTPDGTIDVAKIMREAAVTHDDAEVVEDHIHRAAADEIARNYLHGSREAAMTFEIDQPQADDEPSQLTE